MGIFQDENHKELTKMRMKDAMIIFIGTTIMSLALQYILDPAGLVTGGVSGLAIVLKKVTGVAIPGGIPLWVSNVILNVPIFLFAIKIEGFRAIIRTGLSWMIMSIELAVLPACPYEITNDKLLLVAIYGGVAFGAGMGITLIARATTGGTDMLGNTLHIAFFPHISMGKMIQVLDGAVVVVGTFVFGLERTAYAVISVYIMGKITDMILDHGKRAKIALIISDHSDEIAADVLKQMDRGVTSIKGTGRYSGLPKDILVIVCSNRDIPDLKEIVKKYDKKPFFVIGSISEAMGEGFVEKWA